MSELVRADTGEIVNPALITPVADVDEVIAAFNRYQELKERIAGPDDMVRIGKKMHPTKSFVRKVQKLFNLSCEIVSDEPIRDGGGEIIAWAATVRATYLPTGAFQDADGACELSEKSENQRTLHNIRSHAVTRAKNRAVLDLVGFGEVTAEEIKELVELTDWRAQARELNIPLTQPAGGARKKVDILADIEKHSTVE